MNPVKPEPAPSSAPTQKPATASDAPRRARVGYRLAAGAFVLILAGAGAWWWQHSRHAVFTEDAYVEGNVVQVTSQVGGVVTAILADNTDRIAAGQRLVELNAVDAQLALGAAEAQLARTVRQVRGQFAAAREYRANVMMRAVELERAREDMARRAELVTSGAISGEELVHAKQAVRSAEASVAVASEQLGRNRALIEKTSVATHPDVLAAAVNVRNASIALARNHIPAPVGGVVTKRTVQVGQRIGAGAVLMSVVPLDQLWVTANLKESQLRDVRTGQPVMLTTDLYGQDVKFHGRVEGEDAGTGSAFSLMPAQNATGNWIKVVQRVPVRISLDPAEVSRHPLQVGLSMRVSIDTHDKTGKRLEPASDTAQGYRTTVFENEMAPADERVQRIIDANL